MRIRPLLILTGIVSAILGALVVYLMLSVPNDLRADSLLKDARKHMTDGEEAKARQSLKQILQQYPRTDAAAAATVALVSLEQKERADLDRAVTQLRQQNAQHTKLITDLQKSVNEMRNAPPKIVTVTAPAPKPAAKKASPKRKTTPKRSTRRRR
jgi:thioredoxin-like negative regulator of GroEL